MTTKAESSARRESIVSLLERKELMSATNIGEQLGIEKMSLLHDIRILMAEKRVVREGKSHNIQYRLAAATRRKANGPAPEPAPKANPTGAVDLRAIISEMKAELVILESALAIVEGA